MPSERIGRRPAIILKALGFVVVILRLIVLVFSKLIPFLSYSVRHVLRYIDHFNNSSVLQRPIRVMSNVDYYLRLLLTVCRVAAKVSWQSVY